MAKRSDIQNSIIKIIKNILKGLSTKKWNIEPYEYWDEGVVGAYIHRTGHDDEHVQIYIHTKDMHDSNIPHFCVLVALETHDYRSTGMVAGYITDKLMIEEARQAVRSYLNKLTRR